MQSLYLVCPTDNLEMPIRKEFGGMAFFHTALGVYFELDAPTQIELWEIINEHSINRVIFVSSLQSDFYRKAYLKPKQSNFPVDLELAEISDKILEFCLLCNHHLPFIHLLAAEHLARQKERLLSSEYLGYNLINSNIEVRSYLFIPQFTTFYPLEKVDWKAFLIHNVSLN